MKEATFRHIELPKGDLERIDALWIPILKAYMHRWSVMAPYEPLDLRALCRSAYIQGCMDGAQAGAARPFEL